MKKYIVKLAKEERASLFKLIAQGEASARKLMHARILLKADSSEDGPGWTDQAISEALESGQRRSSGCGSAWWKREWPPRSIGTGLTRRACANWMENRKRI